MGAHPPRPAEGWGRERTDAERRPEVPTSGADYSRSARGLQQDLARWWATLPSLPPAREAGIRRRPQQVWNGFSCAGAARPGRDLRPQGLPAAAGRGDIRRTGRDTMGKPRGHSRRVPASAHPEQGLAVDPCGIPGAVAPGPRRVSIGFSGSARQPGSRCCCWRCRVDSCCDSRTGSSCRCCSRNRREERDSALTLQPRPSQTGTH